MFDDVANNPALKKSWIWTFFVAAFATFGSKKSRVRLTVTCEVWGGHVLDGDLLQEGWLLTARVSTDHPRLLQPLTQPGQVTVTHIWVGQKIAAKDRNKSFNRVLLQHSWEWNMNTHSDSFNKTCEYEDRFFKFTVNSGFHFLVSLKTRLLCTFLATK